MEEYQSAQGISRETSSSRIVNNSRGDKELAKWKAPREGVVKVNWDAAYDKKNKMMGACVIIKDAVGDVLVSLCLKKIHVNSSVVAEIEALRRALKLCSELNIGEAMFQGDALEVVKAVNCADEN
ncbi:hypothetical protein F2P56_002829 [Juglans regia]|uniref:Uncharacterized protein LOC108995597 n=2 Tax=Juglans regia TaxID=51240 RepID=A0A2I4F502_JUGRE|nr:uncharacterized protein LOC108995597 [Juglans regia]KAF5482242.1 hypothetical protein F2P56_002829 [Juglans regia]